MKAAAVLVPAAALFVSGDMPPVDLYTLQRIALAVMPDINLPSLAEVITGAVLLIGVLLLWAAIAAEPRDFRDHDKRDPR